MYYQVPTTKPEPHKYSTVFPWELHAPKPTRVFADEPTPENTYQETRHETHEIQQPPQESLQEPPHVPTEPELPTPPQNQPQPNDPPPPGPLYTRVPYSPSASSYQTYNRSNAWDEDPSIARYIEGVQARRAKPAVSPSHSTHSSVSQSSKISASPEIVPSLPGTPPIHSLENAGGVSQEDWVGVTVDAFSSLLSATYYLWRSTEGGSKGPGVAV
jgi:glycogenin glucosyltransferase